MLNNIYFYFEILFTCLNGGCKFFQFCFLLAFLHVQGLQNLGNLKSDKNTQVLYDPCKTFGTPVR